MKKYLEAKVTPAELILISMMKRVNCTNRILTFLISFLTNKLLRKLGRNSYQGIIQKREAR